MCCFVQVGLLVGRSGNNGRDTVLLWLPTPHVSVYIAVKHLQVAVQVPSDTLNA